MLKFFILLGFLKMNDVISKPPYVLALSYSLITVMFNIIMVFMVDYAVLFSLKSLINILFLLAVRFIGSFIIFVIQEKLVGDSIAGWLMLIIICFPFAIFF